MHDDLVKCLNNPNEDLYSYKYPESDTDNSKAVPVLEAAQGGVIAPDTDEEISISGTTSKKKRNLDGKKKIALITGIVLLVLGIIICLFVFVFKITDSKDVKVPDVTGLALEEAIQKLEKQGFDYTTEEDSSDDIEEDYVISTKPKAGSTRKKGSTVTIVVSTGSSSYLLEDFTGEDYHDIKAMLAVYGINVNIEKKTVNNPNDYVGIEDIIIGQSPTFDENSEEEIRLKKGDTITLYIPDVVDTYPDMVAEEWSLEDAQAFADLYSIKLEVSYEETSDYKAGRVIYQNRSAGSTIVSGITLKIKVAKEKAATYNVYVDFYKEGTTTALDDTLTYKSGLTSGTTGSYNCPSIKGYALVTTGSQTYTVEDKDYTIICYYKSE